MEISASSLMQEMQALKIEAGATPLAQPGRLVTSDFGLLLQQALGNVNELQGAANDLRTRFDMGDKSVDLAEVMIAGQKSSIAFEATVQVRNKMVDAYKVVHDLASRNHVPMRQAAYTIAVGRVVKAMKYRGWV